MRYVTVNGMVSVSASVLLEVPDDATIEDILLIAQEYSNNGVAFENMRSYGRPKDDEGQWFISDDGEPYNLEVEEE